MTVKFRKRPQQLNRKHPSVSFVDKEISQVTFEDQVEISIYYLDNTLVQIHTLDGFIFLNSLIQKKKDKLTFYVLKL